MFYSSIKNKNDATRLAEKQKQRNLLYSKFFPARLSTFTGKKQDTSKNQRSKVKYNAGNIISDAKVSDM